MTEKTSSPIGEDMLLRMQKAIGKEIPPLRSVRDLEQLPADVLQDVETINQIFGSIYAFAYLYHVTEASFHDVKHYIDGKGWHHSVD